MEQRRLNPPDLSIEQLAIIKIKKNPSNSRVHNQKQIAKLRGSIAKFGFLCPITVDNKNELLCGHARVEAAEQPGMPSIPAIKVEHLTELEKRAFVVADNRLAEQHAGMCSNSRAHGDLPYRAARHDPVLCYPAYIFHISRGVRPRSRICAARRRPAMTRFIKTAERFGR